MPNALVEKSFCTTRQAATLLGVSVGTVQLWVESGLLQAWKTTGGHRRVVRESVERLLHKTPSVTPPPIPDVQIPSQPRRLSVLVVDDDPSLLRLYEAKLSGWPMRPDVTCVDNAVSALLVLGRGGPDLLIADLHMPGMDGFHMLRVLDQAPELSNTVVVVVSGLDANAIVDRGGVPDGVEVLGKPIPFDRLCEIATGIAQRSDFQTPKHRVAPL